MLFIKQQIICIFIGYLTLFIMQKVKPTTVYAHMRKLHRGQILCRHTILEDHSFFIKQTIRLDSLSAIYREMGEAFDKDLVEGYSQRTTPMPAILLDYKGEVLDGYKRIAAALKRGDTTIKAYVGGVY